MANMKKLQEAMDLLLNEEDDAADVAIHEYFVGLARKINEEFQDAELEEAEIDFDGAGDDVVSDMEEIDQEEGVIEDEFPNEFGEFGDDDAEGLGDEGEVLEVPENELADMRDELDSLVAKFEQIIGDDEGFEDDGDFGDDDEIGDIEGEEGFEDDGEIGFSDGDLDDEGSENPFESVDLDEEDDELDETLREYTEKVAAPANVEGKEVGTGPTGAVNKQSLAKPKGNLEAGKASPAPSTGGEAKGYAQPKQGKVGSIKGTADNKVKGRAKSSQKRVPKVANTEGGEVGKGKNRGVDKAQLLRQRNKN